MSQESFGQYILNGVVAVGGMAEIFKARYADPTKPQVDIAIKRILPSYTEDDGFVVMFRDEANIATKLIHPNIVRVLEAGEIGKDCYMAMEFIYGADLRQLMVICEKHN